ncbi:hypothetical protein CAXC1_330126 [Candidatus Xenohaliotis californiensis]|uniref:Uncharacterized protein n=1 Tax=Candidatus Xenohaliotis californiensis TaxID=84677 RepID=A0ABM9N8U4_9RICK|nr:hypothetical protein CAXC1_330126 [Candidatus Xenohaliotis californiensis]
MFLAMAVSYAICYTMLYLRKIILDFWKICFLYCNNCFYNCILVCYVI